MSDTALVTQAADTSETAIASKRRKEPAAYDAAAKNRFEFDVREGVKSYETAHVFNTLEDERFMQWLREFHLKGNEDDVNEESREASVRLWDDLIAVVEKIQYPDGEDFRKLIPASEKIEALNAYLSVAIGSDIERVEGDRQLGDPNSMQTVVTECYFNGEIATQKHELRPVTLEMQKKYSRIQQKRFKQEKIGGLRRKAKMEYVPQDDRIGELYDEMMVFTTGFVGDKIPLRFKVLVIDHLFAEKLDQKKSQP